MLARIKSAEDMPKNYICCEKTRIAMLPFHGKVVELVNTTSIQTDSCPWCGHTETKPSFRYANGSPAHLFTDQIDIDEGGQ